VCHLPSPPSPSRTRSSIRESGLASCKSFLNDKRSWRGVIIELSERVFLKLPLLVEPSSLFFCDASRVTELPFPWISIDREREKERQVGGERPFSSSFYGATLCAEITTVRWLDNSPVAASRGLTSESCRCLLFSRPSRNARQPVKVPAKRSRGCRSILERTESYGLHPTPLRWFLTALKARFEPVKQDTARRN